MPIIDVYHLQQSIDLRAAVKNDGVTGVIAKCTQGIDWVDPAFNDFRARSKEVTLPDGFSPFHWLTTDNVTDQAAFFLKTLEDRSDLKTLWTDFEQNDQYSDFEGFVRNAGESALIYKLSVYFGSILATGHDCGVYCNLDFYNRFVSGMNPSILKELKIWIAHPVTPPTIPWDLWQYTGDAGAIIGGCSGIDLNISRQEWEAKQCSITIQSVLPEEQS